VLSRQRRRACEAEREYFLLCFRAHRNAHENTGFFQSRCGDTFRGRVGGHIRQLKPFTTAITRKSERKKTRIFARILMRAKIQTKKLSPHPARRTLRGKYPLRDATRPGPSRHNAFNCLIGDGRGRSTRVVFIVIARASKCARNHGSFYVSPVRVHVSTVGNSYRPSAKPTGKR